MKVNKKERADITIYSRRLGSDEPELLLKQSSGLSIRSLWHTHLRHVYRSHQRQVRQMLQKISKF